jgi:hypothetical protein
MFLTPAWLGSLGSTRYVNLRKAMREVSHECFDSSRHFGLM